MYKCNIAMLPRSKIDRDRIDPEAYGSRDPQLGLILTHLIARWDGPRGENGCNGYCSERRGTRSKKYKNKRFIILETCGVCHFV